MTNLTRRTALTGAAALAVLPFAAHATAISQGAEALGADGLPWPTAFYAAARKRLQSITHDPAVVAGFDRMAESSNAGDAEAYDDKARTARWNDAMGTFLSDAERRNFSLDYIFRGSGSPFMAWRAV